ncbi:MAG TPA: hypothetical protein VI933_02945 [archaeon]|nr:hypothetical protein [archaeon]
MQNHFIALLLLGIVLIAGCTNTQIDAFLKAYPAAKAFTDQYPNAKINTVLVDQKTTVAQLIDISKECGVIPFSDYYKSVIDDVESNTKLTVWMDAKTYKIVCVVKDRIGIKTIIAAAPTTTSTVTSSPPLQTTSTIPAATTTVPQTTSTVTITGATTTTVTTSSGATTTSTISSTTSTAGTGLTTVTTKPSTTTTIPEGNGSGECRISGVINVRKIFLDIIKYYPPTANYALDTQRENDAISTIKKFCTEEIFAQLQAELCSKYSGGYFHRNFLTYKSDGSYWISMSEPSRSCSSATTSTATTQSGVTTFTYQTTTTTKPAGTTTTVGGTATTTTAPAQTTTTISGGITTTSTTP